MIGFRKYKNKHAKKCLIGYNNSGIFSKKMSNLILSEPLASQIRREAAAQGINEDTLIKGNCSGW